MRNFSPSSFFCIGLLCDVKTLQKADHTNTVHLILIKKKKKKKVISQKLHRFLPMELHEWLTDEKELFHTKNNS